MNKDRAVTYGLLAHIREKSTLVKGPIDIFIPLVKRALSLMNSDGITKGENISEIKVYTNRVYAIDFPLPVLKTILEKISREAKSDEIEHFKLFKDGAFIISGYEFTEFEEVIRNHKNEIERIENLFQEFCESSDIKDYKSDSIFDFIESNKTSLGKYLSNKSSDEEDYVLEAEFVSFFKKIPPIYEQIKKIYLGSILASYIEYKTENIEIDVELLFDTNFILGLLDLNTPESKHTCSSVLNIGKSLGYTHSILSDTIEEIQALLYAKAKYFDKSFLQKKVYPEDIYNACDRRNLGKADLERIADNLEEELSKHEIYVIYNTTKYRNKAKFSEEYKSLKKVRNSDKAALHDATAIKYVQEKRGKFIYKFEKVNCWFVNNSTNRGASSRFSSTGKQPESIKADDLLNILWLSNPQANESLDTNDLAEIGLSSLISLSINDSLPKTSIIRELDDNIHKYAEEDLKDIDIVRIATRITNNQLKDINELNTLASSKKEEFVKRLKEESDKQKKIEEKRLKKLEEAVKAFSKKADKFEDARKEFQKKSEDLEELKSSINSKDYEIKDLEADLLFEKNKHREHLRQSFIDEEIKKWRNKSWKELGYCFLIVLLTVVVILYFSQWDINQAINLTTKATSNIVVSTFISLAWLFFTGFVVKSLYDKYRNHSNIENFKKGLSIPEDFKEIKP